MEDMIRVPRFFLKQTVHIHCHVNVYLDACAFKIHLEKMSPIQVVNSGMMHVPTFVQLVNRNLMDLRLHVFAG